MRAAACILAFAAPFALLGAASAQSRGLYSYASARQCAAAGRVPADLCGNAEVNAAAEFEEKSPHFPTRAACERAFRVCSIGLGGAAAFSGGKGGVYFTPRQAGFRIRVAGERDMTVTPVGGGAFRPRSILRRETFVDPRVGRRAREAFRSAPKGAGVAAFGQSEPGAPVGDLPAPVNNDPNFDCAAIMEPGKGDPNTGCYLAPVRKR